jgi:mono/diheme cytochrome c family protein
VYEPLHPARGGAGRRPIPAGLLFAAGVAAALAIVIGRGQTVTRPDPPPTKPVTGAELYANHCAGCHGDKGDGTGPAARFLYPKPRNFGEGRFRIVSTVNNRPSDQDLLNVITRGMPGSAMIPFAHLSEQDRLALVGHVRQLTREGLVGRYRKQAEDEGDDPNPADLAKKAERAVQPGEPLPVPSTLPPPGKESVARGEKVYQSVCASCHGKTGKGDGGQDQRDEDGTPTRPRDLTRGIFKGGRDPKQLYARIMLGMPGTPMPSHSIAFKPDDVGDLVNFILSLSGEAAQAKVEHKRRSLVAKRVPDLPPGETPGAVWAAAPATPIVISPLWWREYAEPDLKVAAVHDGRTLAIRLAWRDASRNDAVTRPEDFEDMAAVQPFKGGPEPFLGMGAGAAQIDLWQWRAGWDRSAARANSKLDDYPFDAPQYRGLLRDKSKTPPDQLTARAAGNPIAGHDPGVTASNLTAKGVGSTTVRPRASQKVSAQAAWTDGGWVVELRRPLAVGAADGIPLAPGDRCSAAFAVWDGAARDRNGQKLVSIWHDLTLE